MSSYVSSSVYWNNTYREKTNMQNEKRGDTIKRWSEKIKETKPTKIELKITNTTTPELSAIHHRHGYTTSL